MFEIKGKYDIAKVFANELEEQAIEQIENILNQPISEGANTRIMPDAHAGKGCVVGYTAKIGEEVNPNLIGVDIGCGVSGVRLKNNITNLKIFDLRAHSRIPTGRNTYLDKYYEQAKEWIQAVYFFAREEGLSGNFFEEIVGICLKTNQDFLRVVNSIGTLGGGNHFCELGLDSEGKQWFFVHSGSRNFGYKVADYWQNIAFGEKEKREKQIENIKANYSGKEIEERIKAIPTIKKEFATLTGENLKGYLRDADIAKKYAELNRRMIISRLFGKNEFDKMVETTHNYIDAEDKIVRKGAIRALKGEELVIPLNMRDGVIFGVGKGNEDYNFSAPHGAGRKMSRSQARKTLSLEEFTSSMEGIYSSCVGESTIDEAPGAYKDMEDIIENIADTIEIKEIIKPIWNFKDK